MIRDLIEIVLTNLKYRKLRSWLTILGVVIGIAAVSSLLSLNQGMLNAVRGQFEAMGTNTILILPGAESSISPMLSMMGSTLEESDVDVVKSVPGVDYAIPAMYKSVPVTFADETKYTMIYAVPSKDGKKLLNFMQGTDLLEGRPLKKGDKNKAVVGYRVYKDMFSQKVNVGSYMDIGGKKFKVVGILKEIGNRMDDNTITIPSQVAEELFGKRGEVDMMFVKVESGANVEEVADRIKLKLKNKRGKEDFQVMTSAQLLERAGMILNLISIVVIGVAMISLIVGAIGIMNTMYMAVLERTRHIGIMKAIGAREKDIMIMFLLESGMIGLVGGAIGLSIGLGLAKIVEVYAAHSMGTRLLQASLSPWIILGSLAFSFLVGILSGVLPARSAAKLDPVEALRYE